jgi:hypothetical protein
MEQHTNEQATDGGRALMVDPVITWLEQILDFTGSTPASKDMAQRARQEVLGDVSLQARNAAGVAPGGGVMGTRIEKKGRTKKQQAAADRYKRTQPTFPSASEAAPSASWWTTPRTWDEFSARAAAERERMSRSTFGRIRSHVTAKDFAAAGELV